MLNWTTLRRAVEESVYPTERRCWVVAVFLVLGCSPTYTFRDTGSWAEYFDTRGSEAGAAEVGAVRIQDIQRGSVEEGRLVRIDDVTVTSPSVGYGFFVQDAEGGDYSGLWVYHSEDAAPPEGAVYLGARVSLIGTYKEYEGLSELVLQPGGLTSRGGGTLPVPVVLDPRQVVAETDAEPYEGVVVAVTTVAVRSGRDEHGQFTIDEGAVVDDKFYEFTVDAGDTIERLAGPLDYTYGEYKIQPRDADDVVGWATEACAADLCAEDLAAGDLVVTELMIDPAECADADCEWIELWNATTGSVDLAGVVIEDMAENAGTISEELIVPANGYVVLAAGDGLSWGYLGFEPDYFYGNLSLNNSGGDQVSVYVSTDTGRRLVDRIAAYPGAAAESGRAWQLSRSHLDHTDNDSLDHWCGAVAVIDRSADLGTPGARNDNCVH